MKKIIYLIIISFLVISCQHYNKDPEVINEFSHRYNLAYNRLTHAETKPEFTREFILADVVLDENNPRRFSEFSGDLSGRYIEILSLAAKKEDLPFLHKMVDEVLTYQQPDGRFGNPDLDFQQANITGDHMALLWGNGRMLVGLLTYYDAFKNPKVLEAAKKLGDFYLTTYAYTASPETIEKLEGFGAQGIICFTQYIEGLTRLTQLTGQNQYVALAEKVYPLLPSRGIQHAHGYLTTLRGVLNLYEYTGNKNQLDFVASQFNSLIISQDYTLFGSVMEYFGGKGIRDEGCASADFVRLAMQLYNLTGNLQYLELAENALFNALYFNQYNTGDFGHHILTSNKTRIYESSTDTEPLNTINGASSHFRMTAWWCCTMHGLRAYEEMRSQLFRSENDKTYINLYIETILKKDQITVEINRIMDNKVPLRYNIKVETIKGEKIYLRKPPWVSDYWIKVSNLNPEEIEDKDGYISFESAGNNLEIEIGFQLKLALVSGNKLTELKLSGNSISGEGYLKYGPYLMCIDDNIDPDFAAEPNNNILDISTIDKVIEKDDAIYDSNTCIKAKYHHGGFVADLNTMLRPVKNLAFEKRPMTFILFDFQSN